MRLSAHLLRVESLFPKTLQVSCMQFSLDIKARHFEVSSSWCRNPELRNLMWDLDTSLLVNILSNGDYLCF